MCVLALGVLLLGLLLLLVAVVVVLVVAVVVVVCALSAHPHSPFSCLLLDLALAQSGSMEQPCSCPASLCHAGSKLALARLCFAMLQLTLGSGG